jgi:aryl-alcohol dehydrogenase-like predicted oxidoreductase
MENFKVGERAEMEYSTFGQTDLNPSVIGFGCGRIASVSTSNHRKEIVATLHEALDRGINFFDTADIYGQGDSERLLGSVFRGHRLLLCSKAGYTFGTARYIPRWLKPLAQRVLRRWKSGRTAATAIRGGLQRQNFAPAHIRAAVEGSLRRLGTEYLDLFLLHCPPAEVIANGTALEALVRLKECGLVRYYGVSCATTADALACLRYPGISVLQIAVNLFQTEVINKVLPLAIERKAAIVAREPFAQGTLLTDRRLFDCLKKNPSRTPAQTALRFVMQLRGVGVVLPGMTSRVHLEENTGALLAPPLTPEEIGILCPAVRSDDKEARR